VPASKNHQKKDLEEKAKDILETSKVTPQTKPASIPPKLLDIFSNRLFQICLTLVLLLTLFAATLFLSYFTVKKKQTEINKDVIPKSEIQLPANNLAPMANWETYTNESQNISFKYPPDWIKLDIESPVERETVIVRLQSPTVVENPVNPINYWVTLHNRGPANGKTAKQITDEAIELVRKNSSNLSDFEPDEREKLFLGGEEAELTSGFPSRMGHINVEFVHNDTRYTFSLSPYNLALHEWESAKYSHTFRQIISTFQFTDQKVQGVSTTFCLETEQKMLEEISECESINEKKCQTLKKEFDSCLLSCLKDLRESSLCFAICKPVCNNAGEN
jgi:hypothetical protein